MIELESNRVLSGTLLIRSDWGSCMKIWRWSSCLLVGVLGAFPLVCLSSGIYKVEDEKGHVTYTNTPLNGAIRKDATRLNGGSPINIIVSRGDAQARLGNSAVTSRHENAGPAGQQKLNNSIHQITNQDVAVRSRQLGDSLRVSGNSAALPGSTTREKFVRDQLGIDDYNIQVFDLKIKSF